MSLAELKQKAADLEQSQQRELIAFLVSRQTEADDEFRKILAEKIDNNDPDRWVDLDDLQKRWS